MILLSKSHQSINKLRCFFEIFEKNNMAGKIFKLEEISGLKLDSLDKDNTVVIIPIGILEYHAHHLPYGTDLFINNAVTEGITKGINKANPKLDLILYPNIPLGVFGIENLAPSKFSEIGSFVISSENMTKVLVEIGSKFGQFKFKNIVFVSFHGAPDHCKSINKASDILNRKNKMNTFPLMSYLFFPLFFGGKFIPEFEKEIKRKFTDAERKGILHFVHAELVETSILLYLKPGLVNPIYKNLKPVVYDYEKMFDEIQKLDDWDGYVGVPSLSKKEIGKAVLKVINRKSTSLVQDFINNKDFQKIKRYPDGLI